jgi:nitroreductase
MPLNPDLPPAPSDGAAVNAACESPETLRLMALRRSTKIAHLGGPGPDRQQIETLLRIAGRVPDHGKLAPWRFVVIEGEARSRAGDAVAQAMGEAGAPWREMFLRAPVCVMVVSAAAPHPKIPEWEQVLSAGAAAYSLLLAGHAMGFAGCWLTDPPAYHAGARAALGLAEHEQVAGFVYLGTAQEPATERERKPASTVTHWY